MRIACGSTPTLSLMRIACGSTPTRFAAQAASPQHGNGRSCLGSIRAAGFKDGGTNAGTLAADCECRAGCKPAQWSGAGAIGVANTAKNRIARHLGLGLLEGRQRAEF